MFVPEMDRQGFHRNSMVAAGLAGLNWVFLALLVREIGRSRRLAAVLAGVGKSVSLILTVYFSFRSPTLATAVGLMGYVWIAIFAGFQWSKSPDLS